MTQQAHCFQFMSSLDRLFACLCSDVWAFAKLFELVAVTIILFYFYSHQQLLLTLRVVIDVLVRYNVMPVPSGLNEFHSGKRVNAGLVVVGGHDMAIIITKKLA